MPIVNRKFFITPPAPCKQCPPAIVCALGGPIVWCLRRGAPTSVQSIMVLGRQVPITYTREMAWATELLRLLPTIGLIGLYIWFTRRQLGGGFGGGGGMGGRGIFNVGKAQVRRLRLHVCIL